MIARSPGFTVAAVLVLAFGIGANSAMFSVVNAALRHAVPYPQPDELVTIFETNPKLKVSIIQPSTANYLDWRDRTDSLGTVAHWRFVYFNVSGSGDPERSQGFRVSANFLPMLGGTPMLGRSFLPDEEQPGRDLVVVVSYGFWQRHFAVDLNLVGRQIAIDGQAATVIGVLPPEFQMVRVLNREIDLYMPLVLDRNRSSREDHAVNVWARLRPGVSLERARAELETIGHRLEREYPNTNSGWGITILTLPEAFAIRNRPAVIMFGAGTGLVLLIVCANIANLLLARAASRRREMAIRTAMGAGRLRLVRQLLTESLALALLGGAVGLLVGAWAIQVLNNSITQMQVARVVPFHMDAGVFGFTLAVALGTSVLFGLAPGLASSKPDLSGSLREGGRSSTTGRASRRLSDSLVISEVALAVLLLVGAGVMLRSSLALVAMERGLGTHNVLTAQVGLQKNRYGGRQQVVGFIDEVIRRIQALPGIESATAVNFLPTGVLNASVHFSIEGRPPAPRGEPLNARYWVIGPDYFRTLGIPLISGRVFTHEDADESRGSVIVSERFARRFWPGENPLGHRVRPEFPTTDAFWLPYSSNVPLTVVGVARDIVEEGLDNGGPPQLYLPYRQNPSQIMHLVVRTSGPPKQWAAAVRGAVESVDRDQPISEIKTMEEVTAESFSRRAAIGYLLGIFAACALLLAAVGIYAVLAYSVTQRTHEIGIRMALGAKRSSVVRLVLGQSMRLVLLGIAIGLGAAFGLARALEKLLFGVRMDNPVTWVGVSLLLIAVAALASYLPARRATRVDPLDALRCE